VTAVHGQKTRVLLFSPAIVLLLWSFYLALNEGESSSEVTIFFLIATAMAVMLAEIVRQKDKHDGR